ncbi:MAG: RluA family pseudouridine synthase, partial [Pseudoflavonifractor sp.]
MEQRRLALTVTAAQAGVKVDTLLRSGLGLSGTVIRRIKWYPDGILLDGVRVQTDARCREGQFLSALVSDGEGPRSIVPAPGPLDIVYEDQDMLVLNKAAGMLVHPGAGHYDDTLGNFLLYYYNKSGISADFHPVHRLDK